MQVGATSGTRVGPSDVFCSTFRASTPKKSLSSFTRSKHARPLLVRSKVGNGLETEPMLDPKSDIVAIGSPEFVDRLGPEETPLSGVAGERDLGSGNPITEYWEALPGRYRVMAATCMAFILCNMDKVNMSVAIVPMAQSFGWNASVSGLVQSSFFYGYMLCQLPGGYLSSKFTGARMLPLGVGLWSLATAAVPILGGSIGGLCASRAAVGLGESVSPSAATDMVARSVPKEERSRAVSLVFGGFHLGTVLGLLASPILVENFGWESVFYVFGIIGLVWVVFFEGLVADVRKTDPEFIGKLTAGNASNAAPTKDSEEEAIPWRAIVRARPIQALMYTHFCNNWFHFTMMAWLPTYFIQTLRLDLTHASQIALLPPLAGIAISSIAGNLADSLMSQGWDVSTVRKIAQCTAFLGPMLCLLCASLSDDGVVDVVAITSALGLGSFSLAGLYCNHQDLSPKYASVMLGITNTIGALPGIAGVAITGFLLDQTDSWPLALFVPSMFFFLTGSIVYTMYGSCEPLDLSDDKPFEFEKNLKAPEWSDLKVTLEGAVENWVSGIKNPR